MVRQDPSQSFARILAGLGFLPGQQKCGFVSLAIARKTALGRRIENTIVPGVISRSQVIKEAAAAVEIARTTVAISDIAHFPEERRLLPKVGSLPAAEKHIEAIGVTGAVVTGEAVHAEPEKHAADIRRDLVDPIQPVETFVIVGVRPQPAARRDVSDRIIESLRRREPLCVFGRRRDDVRKDVVIGAVHLEPLLCPEMKLCFTRPQQFAKVICPLVGEFLGADERIDQLVALIGIGVSDK